MPDRRCCLLVLGSLLFVLCSGSPRSSIAQDRPAVLVAPTDPLPPAEQLKKFRLPPGFEIQLVAAEPEIAKPINLNFDHRGRLLVTQSIEYPFPAQDAKPGRDAVKQIEIVAGSGKALRVATLVDGLNIPIGVTPVPGGVLVYSIPNLLMCPSGNGAAAAPERTVLYREFGFRDTHGMCSSLTRWVDGWIYACHGFSNTSTVQGADGQPIVMQSGNTFRLRADGSHLEYFTHGQVNPFGLCFDPLGNLYSADCHTRPVYMLLRGAWYPSFGKPHDGLGFGPEMIRHSHGSTGLSGVAYYAAEQFPAEYRDTLFIGNPVTNRVNHDRLKPHGSTYEAVEQPDFISCDDPWFRPVDVKVGPDGALYIADFYNRIIGHYEVPLDHPGRDRERGRIWRVVWKGTDGQAVPPQPVDLTQSTLPELLAWLGDTNLVVRTIATNELIDRFPEQAADSLRALLAKGASSWQRAHGLWVLDRLHRLDDGLAFLMLNDSNRTVRVQALKALAEWPNWGESGRLATRIRGRLDDDDAFVRRAAADALGRHPQAENLAPLLKLWNATPADDTHLVHVVRMALRDHLAAPQMYAEAAEQFGTQPDALQKLAEISLGVPTAEAAEFLFAQLRASTTPVRIPESLQHAVRYLPAGRLTALYEFAISQSILPPERQATMLRAVHRGTQERGISSPATIREWALQLTKELLSLPEEARIRTGLELAGEQKLQELHSLLATWTTREARFEGLRRVAIDACVAADAAASVPLLDALLIDGSEPFPVRQKSAQALAGINNGASRDVLAKSLRTAAGPLAVEIAAGLAIARPGAELLLAAMAEGKASPLLLDEPAVLGRLRGAQVPELESHRSKLLAGLPPRDARIKQLIDQQRQAFSKTEGDLELGKAVYVKNCAACHRVGGQGTKIGPELDGIGIRGLDRLLEDVLDPNRNIDQAYRSTVLTTKDGRALSGLALREEGQVLVLADAQGKEVRVGLSEIAERALTPLSPMPANAGELIKEADFQHLLAYLLSQRQAK